MGPLLEVELELATPDMIWKPELAGSIKGSLQALVQNWLMSFLEVRLVHSSPIQCSSFTCSQQDGLTDHTVYVGSRWAA